MKVWHSTRTAILQLVDPACLAALERVETRIWNFRFLSVFCQIAARACLVLTGGENREILIFHLAIILMKKILEHTDNPATTHLGLPNLCINSSESSANRYEIDK